MSWVEGRDWSPWHPGRLIDLLDRPVVADGKGRRYAVGVGVGGWRIHEVTIDPDAIYRRPMVEGLSAVELCAWLNEYQCAHP